MTKKTYDILKIIPVTFIILSVFITGINMVNKNYIRPVEDDSNLQNAEDEYKVYDDGLLDINTATFYELVELPGIGEKTAGNIIRYRLDTGGFKSIDELLLVDGISEKKYNALIEFVTVKTK